MSFSAHFRFSFFERSFTLAVLLALLLPTLLGILPAPALSAEQQLLLDSTQNICSQISEHKNQKQQPNAHHQCCILCNVQSLALPQYIAVTIATPSAIGNVSIKFNWRISALPRAPPDLRATAPRAPPA
jgi:hypothetical protein